MAKPNWNTPEAKRVAKYDPLGFNAYNDGNEAPLVLEKPKPLTIERMQPWQLTEFLDFCLKKICK